MIAKDYELHAQGVAQSIGLRISISLSIKQMCPSWSRPCDHMHGHKYVVTLKNTRGDNLQFSYWGSVHDKATDKHPTAYDVLACISSDASMPTDPDEIVEELGPMRPSQAIAVAEFSKKLQTFFRKHELERLAEVS